MVVVKLKYLNDRLEHLRLISSKPSNQTLSASKKGLLVTLGGNKLHQVSIQAYRWSKYSTYLLEHASTLRNLSNNVLVENGLNKNKNSAVLVLDAEFLGLDIDIDRFNFVNVSLLLSLRLDPVTELIVDSGTAIAFFVVVIANVKLLLELAGERRLAGLDSFLTHVNSPLVLLDFVLLGDFSSLGLDLLKLIVATNVLIPILVGTVLGSFIAASTVLAVGAICSVTVLSSLLGSPSLGLVFLTLLGLVLEDEATKLEAKVNISTLTTGFAVKKDMIILNDDVGLRILALLAKDKLVDETVEVILEFRSIMSAVDDPTVILGVNVGLSTKFKPEVLDDVGTGTGEGGSDTAQVDNDGLDTVSLAFDLGLQTLHLVTIESIADIAANVDESHGDGIDKSLPVK